MITDEISGKEQSPRAIGSSLLSGSLSMALCYIQRVFHSGPLHPQPRILCLQGSPDGPKQYFAVMNAIFSTQRSMSCVFILSPLTNNSKQQPPTHHRQHILPATGNSSLHPASSSRPPAVEITGNDFSLLFRHLTLPEVYMLSPNIWMGYSNTWRLFLLQTCILATSYSFQDLLVLISVHRVFAIRLQLTWATFVLYVCP